jgi:hypothetical protein
MQGTGQPPPAIILLDFAYGMAAWKTWDIHNSEFSSKLKNRHKTYQDVLSKRDEDTTTNNSNNKFNGNEGQDDQKDPDYKHGSLSKARTRSHKDRVDKEEFSDDMLNAMDSLLAFNMMLRGTTVEAEIAAQKKRKEEAEMRAEMHAREVGRMRVDQWLTDMDG